jgi:hypothetical protein
MQRASRALGNRVCRTPVLQYKRAYETTNPILVAASEKLEKYATNRNITIFVALTVGGIALWKIHSLIALQERERARVLGSGYQRSVLGCLISYPVSLLSTSTLLHQLPHGEQPVGSSYTDHGKMLGLLLHTITRKIKLFTTVHIYFSFNSEVQTFTCTYHLRTLLLLEHDQNQLTEQETQTILESVLPLTERADATTHWIIAEIILLCVDSGKYSGYICKYLK